MEKSGESANKKDMPLRERILSSENIYNAIFSMESYVFNENLMNRDDWRTYKILQDKFNTEILDVFIGKCRDRLTLILDDPENLFDVKVYFKLKKYEDEEISYRPIHTASLLDMICMVCLLQALMFEDDETREFSDLSKQIPHNFYGNRPSTEMGEIFVPWQKMYGEYSASIIKCNNRFRQSHEYKTEVCLDIENFFPSISPFFICSYAYRILTGRYVADNDRRTLAVVISKLSILRLDADAMEEWEKEYYGLGISLNEGIRLAKGVAQGLPQSYFFGNLCMVEIRKILNLKDFFQGKALFYVDDSVIYLKSSLNNEKFRKVIVKLNEKIKKEFNKYDLKTTDPDVVSDLSSDLRDDAETSIGLSNGSSRFCKDKKDSDFPVDVIHQPYGAFHNKMKYEIRFYVENKSEIRHIDDTKWSLNGLDGITRQPSGIPHSGILLDEIDQQTSRKKLKALDDYVMAHLRMFEGKINDDEIEMDD